MFDNNYQNSGEQSQKTFLSRAANDGAILGIVMSLIVVFMAYGTKNGLFALLSLVLAVAVPYLVYRFIKQGFTDTKSQASFSMLWMQGINTFLCGGLLMALVIFVCLRFVFPEFIFDQVASAIEVYRSFGDAATDQIADSLQAIIDQNLLPTPISIAMSFMFLSVFTGSILSAIVSLIVRSGAKKDASDQQTPPPFTGNNAN